MEGESSTLMLFLLNSLLFPQTNLTTFIKISKDTYNKLLQDDFTKSYKKFNVTLIKKINKEAKTIATELKLDDKTEQFNQREVFVTLKDHKVNFKNDPKCTLIKPAKWEIGIISKHYLEFINNKIR